jgi:Zn-dependent protease with chaperone function
VIADDEAESASNAYLLSLVLLVGGAPLPILNLLASVIFFFGARRSAPFVRWHSTQALIGQLVMIPINSTFLWMTVSLLFGHRELDDFYVGWGLVMLGLNAAELGASIYAAIKVRKGEDVRWWGVAPIVDALLGREGWLKSLVRAAAMPVAVAALMFGATRVPWTGVFQTEKVQGRLEAKINDLIEDALESDNQTVRDPEMEATLRKMVKRICEGNRLECADYRIHLMRDMAVNAATLPGGHIIVNAGLVFAAPDADAVAGVLAHELAHAERGHVRGKLLREIGLSVLLGTNAEQSLLIFRRMVSLSYDRDMESEADRTAVDWLVEAKINPTSFANFLASMADGGTMPLTALARSHPGSEERALKILDRVPAKAEWSAVLTAEEWAGFKKSLSAVVTKT